MTKLTKNLKDDFLNQWDIHTLGARFGVFVVPILLGIGRGRALTSTDLMVSVVH